MEDKATKLFEDAIQKLKDANEELYRPEEDVVSYMVCKNAHIAIENFLRGFLVQNGVDTDNYNTIDSLYEQCKTINKNFKEVNLAGFECNAHKEDSRFHNKPSKFSRCFDIADSLDTFLRREKIIN